MIRHDEIPDLIVANPAGLIQPALPNFQPAPVVLRWTYIAGRGFENGLNVHHLFRR